MKHAIPIPGIALVVAVSGGFDGFYCHTAQDLCSDDADCCQVPAGRQPYCAYSREVGYWTCGNSTAAG